jgi:hypothetical protein
MTTMESIKARQEVEDLTAKIMRLLIDMVPEQKRAVWVEVDKWISLEEASHDPSVIDGRRH